jgi:hypothetical protein
MNIPNWEQYCSDRNVAKAFENQVLYAMCRDNPNHACAYINSGKITAIGRIYAAAPERGAGKSASAIEAFPQALGRRFASSKIDEVLAKIPFKKGFSKQEISEISKIHGYLVNEIFECTKDWSASSLDENWKPRNQASFASKYLHFHRPNFFPIMDLFAKTGLKCFEKKHSLEKASLDSYAKFCDALCKYVEVRNECWTLRDIDSELVLLGRNHKKCEDSCVTCGYQKKKRAKKEI